MKQDRPISRSGTVAGGWFARIKPLLYSWLWLIPALLFIGVFLLYPALDTLRLSFMNADSTAFAGMDNYAYVFTDRASQLALLNNLLWLLLFPAVCVAAGTLFATLFARVRYESAAKAVVFIPMAISFVAAAVIWRFMYSYRPEGAAQIGLVNAMAGVFDLPPVAWLVTQPLPYSGFALPSPLHTNNFAIVAAGIWMWTGFALVILSASLKAIPGEIIEAARIDGASEWQIFLRIIVPLLWPTIAVVGVTLLIQALKSFDMVWVMTSGNYGTDVIATLMFKQMFNYQDFGRAGALAIVLLACIVPFMVISIKRFRTGKEA